MKQLTRQEVKAVLAKIAFLRFEETPTQSGNFGPGLIPGKRPIYKMGPIKIGDVLEKMGSDDYIPDGFFKNKKERLLYYWGECGFSKSLQQIVDESGYMIYTDLEYAELMLLKSPEANALFSFLQEIL